MGNIVTTDRPARGHRTRAERNHMNSYKITLLYYSGKREIHYIKAQNGREAFSKAHKFCNPFDIHDGVHFIIHERVNKAYCKEHNVQFED